MRRAALALLLCACSPSARIAHEATGINERAVTICEEAERIGQTSKEADTDRKSTRLNSSHRT